MTLVLHAQCSSCPHLHTSTTHHIFTDIFPTTFNPHCFKNILSSTVVENFEPVSPLQFMTLKGVVFNQVIFFFVSQKYLQSVRLQKRTFNGDRLAIRHWRLAAGQSWLWIIRPHSDRHVCSPRHYKSPDLLVDHFVTIIAIRWFGPYITGRSFRVFW